MCRLLQTSGGGRVLCCGSALPQGVFQVGVVLRFTSLTSVWPLSLPACRCKYCSVKLGQIFFVREDKPCCSKCHREAEEECWVCKKKISDDHIYCNKKFYHPKCMKVSKLTEYPVHATQSLPAWKLFDISRAFHFIFPTVKSSLDYLVFTNTANHHCSLFSVTSAVTSSKTDISHSRINQFARKILRWELNDRPR